MHIRDFMEICDTFKFNGVSEDAVKLRVFPFSLRDKAKGWLQSDSEKTTVGVDQNGSDVDEIIHLEGGE